MYILYEGLFIFIFILLFYPILIFAQYKADNDILDVKLDTVSITHSGFTVEDFIRMTKTDTSFYRAFKNLRIFDFVYIFSIKKKWKM